MLVIGLTGGIGSGKSAAGHFFKELGIEVVDADQASRAVVEKGSSALKQIAEHFGNDILDANGELNRRKLRDLIFADKNHRLWLEGLLHPLIGNWINQKISHAKSPYAILESPLLLETNQHNKVAKVIVVDVPEQIQIERYISRDGGNEAAAKAVINSQMARADRLAKADYVLENSSTLEDLKQQVYKLHKQFISEVKHHEP